MKFYINKIDSAKIKQSNHIYYQISSNHVGVTQLLTYV